MDVLNNAESWWVANQALLISYVVNIAAAGAILFGGWLVAGMLSSGAVKLMEQRGLDKTLTGFSGSMIKYALLAFVIIAALSRVGVQTASFVAVIGAAGLAIGLALQGSLANFAAGVLIVLFRPFKAGEFVDMAGVSGSVSTVHIFTTELLTPDNKLVVVPNNAALSGTIVNYSRMDTRRLDLVIGVSYSAELGKTKAILSRILQEDSRVLPEPAPLVAVGELADSSVNFNVRPWVNTADYWALRADLLERIKLELDQAGIEIPFPQMDVHVTQAK